MHRDTILIVDDMEINRTILCGLFKDEYHLLEAENGEQALFLLEQYHSSIAIMLLDVVMPEKNGYQVLEEMNGNGMLSEVPVIVITADDSLEGELRAFDLGASDIIAKPFEPHVVKRRVDNIIELYLHRHNLENLVDEQAVKLRESNDVLIDALSSVIEYRSLESGQHIKRIRMLTKVLLEEVKQTCPEYGLNEHKINAIASASAMHDIGKIAIPDNILNKPGKLTAEEFEIMKTHSVKGCEILASLARMDNKEYLRYAYNICRHHHERWDGNGYPDGLAGDAIPICAQVTGIADAYDALTSDRIYKKAIPHEQAVDMILGGECGAFSPSLLKCFERVKQQMAVLVKRYADGKLLEEETARENRPADVFRQENISAFEKERMKYQAMLRFVDATVAEIDLAAGSWQLVYSYGLNGHSLLKGENLDAVAQDYMKETLHPADQEQVRWIWEHGLAEFFEEGRFRQTWMHRIKENAGSEWEKIEMTIVRLDTEHPQQKKGLMIWKKIEGDDSLEKQDAIIDSHVFRSIFHGIRQMRNDKWLTIEHIEDSFLGYSHQEIEERFDNRYINLIHPEDRSHVIRQLALQLNQGSEYEVEYRAINAQGKIVWLLSKGRLLIDRQGREVLFGVPIDIAKTKNTEEQLQMSLERYKIILEQTNDIIFEWDIASDHVDFSSNWKEKFGYEPIMEHASERIVRVSHLHPDDMKPFDEYIREMKAGKRYNEIEFRVSDAKGRYRWSKIRATTQFDSKGVPCKVIGLIGDIDAEKQATQELQARAERDILTKLYNRDCARKRIEQRLTLVDSDTACALFVIDLDNFKLVNDRYGHMFGDAVLKKIAEQLTKIFRSEDVLSRIGGDEFMALLQGELSKRRIKAIAERIIKRFHQTFENLPQDCRISCSIGIAVSPDDGMDYKTLFQKADIALYRAKASGKKQFCFYDMSLDGMAFCAPEVRAEIVGTNIDSDGSDEAAVGELVPAAFHILSENGDMDTAVSKLLEMVGLRLDVDRVSVFEVSDDRKFYHNTFEWCNEGILPLKSTLQNRPFKELGSDYFDHYNDRGVLYASDLTQFPPNIRTMMKDVGIKSVLQCAVRVNGSFGGWVGFSHCANQRFWTSDQIDILSFIAELLSTFLLKERIQQQALARSGELQQLMDSWNTWLYIIDPKTYEILYINKKARGLSSEAKKGAICHQVFLGKETACDDCPAKLAEKSQSKIKEFYSQNLQAWIAAEATVIRWENQDAYLIELRDITPYKEL